MQQDQSSNGEPENKCPSCVFIKLESSRIKEGWLWDRQTKAIELFLTVSFNEQEEKILGGAIRFGIKRGTLSLALTNCRSPYENRGLNDILQHNLLLERYKRSSNEEKRSSGFSISPNKISAKIDSELEKALERTDKIKFDTHQVSTKGSEANPIWDFQVKTGEPCLKGTIPKEVLAILTVDDVPCKIEATFTASLRELHIEGIEGLWPGEISRNKMAVMERWIVRHFLEPKLEPYLSRQELKYD
ncbi:MAG: hypothetical protein F6J93_34585 [Oscillatoria sp. SIO1A7]|nr:hypothetical protein [Oscillatoria sp. SIO1A7]